MPKSAQILAAPKRDGWQETRRRGSHRTLKKGSLTRIWAYHDGHDLGKVQLAQIARDYGYRTGDLRKLSRPEGRPPMQLRVEYLYDPESNNWSFRVPSLGILGGADTRDEAERAAIEAIAYALEEGTEGDGLIEGAVQYLELAVQR